MTLTSVGYGDVCPVNMKEYWVSCVCMSVSAALWAFIIGEVCRIAASVDPHEARFMHTMDDLNSLMKSRQMPRSMRMNMRTYLYEAREVSRQRAQLPIIEQMSPMLQGQMAMQLHEAWLKKVWYLRAIEGQALVNIARALTADFFAPGEEVAGSVWGEDMVLSNQVLRDEAPVKAISYLEVLMLHYTDLMLAVKAFPEVCAQIQKVKVKMSVLRGVILVARAMRDVAFREEVDVSEITEEVEQYIVQKVLTGSAGGTGSRTSQALHASLGSRTPRTGSDTGRRYTVMGTPTIANRRSMTVLSDAPGSPCDSQSQAQPDIEALTLAIQQLTVKVDRLSAERRPSRVELYAGWGALLCARNEEGAHAEAQAL
eukprot:CAMPEP_0175484416 /NCGR_PEP_ID=MMETSP0095-20121207/79985_1 /TAXON_ID=311494 /ORGANISM="Alexandrium monilatum, Strain CCMP3105" /LENGTH=369 /DNA_ID=CAMNT_0016786141 /DNA_START=144 /DNA_END=1250 /DNA_ORIENTATION=-